MENASKALRFTNWTNTDFIGYWNKVEYLIEAGETIMLEEYLAKHFAEHLIDRETGALLIKKTNDDGTYADRRFQILIEKCFNAENAIVAKDAAELATVMMNERVEVLATEKKVEPKKKVVGKPAVNKVEIKEVEESKEETFEGEIKE